MKTITAQVTNTNHHALGAMQINVDLDPVGPSLVEHKGRTYCFTHKTGTNLSTGLEVREMATFDDARLWITLDGTKVWED